MNPKLVVDHGCVPSAFTKPQLEEKTVKFTYPLIWNGIRINKPLCKYTRKRIWLNLWFYEVNFLLWFYEVNLLDHASLDFPMI